MSSTSLDDVVLGVDLVYVYKEALLKHCRPHLPHSSLQQAQKMKRKMIYEKIHANIVVQPPKVDLHLLEFIYYLVRFLGYKLKKW